jgi:transcriptional regulator with XRE-family HTH domain
MEFGKYLEVLIIKSGLSLRELAKRSHVSHTYLSQVKNGKRGIPSPEILMSLAPHLGVDYMELMKAAGYVMVDEEFTDEEIAYLQQHVEDGAPLLELLKYKPTVDQKEVTESELELAVNVIRTLRQTKEKE